MKAKGKTEEEEDEAMFLGVSCDGAEVISKVPVSGGDSEDPLNVKEVVKMVPAASISHYNDDKLLVLVTIIFVSTDEIVWSRPVKREGSVSICEF